MAESRNSAAATTVLLFGASNLTLGWSAVIRQLQQQLPGRLNVHCLLGMGRSWIRPSRYGVRVLPGILQSEFWDGEFLDKASCGIHAKVLLTDIGNDIIYGFTAEQITAAVLQTIQRIRGHREQSDFVLTRPPMNSLRTLSSFRFAVARRLLFPGSMLTMQHVLDCAHELDERILALGRQEQITVVEPRAEWYGWDPIHVRRGHREAAFAEMMAGWSAAEQRNDCRADAVLCPQLPTAALQIRFGRELRVPQPVYRHASLQISAW